MQTVPDLKILGLYDGDLHSVETILRILIFSWAKDVWYDTWA